MKFHDKGFYLVSSMMALRNEKELPYEQWINELKNLTQ